MRVHYRKVYSVLCAFTFLLLSTVSVAASTWENTYTSGGKTCLDIVYSYYNLYQNTGNSTFSGTLVAGGVNYWDIDSEIGNRITYSYIPFDSSYLNSSGLIMHTTPTTSFWAVNMLGSTAHAVTWVYDSYGNNCTSYYEYSSILIRNAVVWYNPNSSVFVYESPENSGNFYGFTDVYFKSTVAHESGHAIGFGHNTAGIMRDGAKSDTGLSSTDRCTFYAFYGQ